MDKYLITTFLLIKCIVCVVGSPCEVVEGKWYNQLGSELILTKDSDGFMTGEYRTAVERVNGSAGENHATLKGLTLRDNPGHIVGFSAIFNSGRSVTSWIGQCKKCGSEETLKMSWILKTSVETCADEWKSNMINEDTFTRKDIVFGPRKHHNTHVPKRPYNWIRNDKLGNRYVDNKPNEEAMQGKWHAEYDSELEFEVDTDDGSIRGTFLDGASDSKSMKLFGTMDPINPSGVFGMASISEDKAVVVWVGQYFPCEGQSILHTSWLRVKSRDDSCKHAWDSTSFGRFPAFSCLVRVSLSKQCRCFNHCSMYIVSSIRLSVSYLAV